MLTATAGRPSVVVVPNRLAGDDCASTLEAGAAARRDAVGTGVGEIHVSLSIVASIGCLFISTTMIGRRDEYWDIQKRRATQIESSNRHAVGGKSMHRARKKELIGCHSAMEDAPLGSPKDTLQIKGRQALSCDYACLET